MAGMNFQYDESGGTFYYFLLSFYGLVLIPLSFWFWPSDKKNKDKNSQKCVRRQCSCEPCLVKRQIVGSATPWQSVQRKVLKVVLVLAWIGFIATAYKVAQLRTDAVEYNPYEVLGVDQGATPAEIRKAFRRLSVVHHPDKESGNEQTFRRIAKAYEALTDEESRKNWEEFGNPDGPTATQFGIALPKWMVEGHSSMWLLLGYVGVFMIILPIVVGTWWYKTIKYSGDQVLIHTTHIFHYYIQKTPSMIFKRALMILGSAAEFSYEHNQEIAQRPTDNEEIPPLIKMLPNLNEKNKERPLCLPYSIKARTLLHAQLSRLELPPATLDRDRVYILKKVSLLINEMVKMCAYLVFFHRSGQAPGQHQPRVESVECIMKLSPLLVQGLWDTQSPLLQLPHVSEDMLKHFVSKKRSVKNVRQFVALPADEQRGLLRHLTDVEYQNVINVCLQMPCIEMACDTKVLDDEDSTNITAGSIVTVTVTLVRSSMEKLMCGGTGLPAVDDPLGFVDEDVQADEDGDDGNGDADDGEDGCHDKAAVALTAESKSQQQKKKVWEKPSKKRKAGTKKKPAKLAYVRPKAVGAPGQLQQATVENVGAKPESLESGVSTASTGKAGKKKEGERQDENAETGDDGAGDSKESEGEESSAEESEHAASSDKEAKNSQVVEERGENDDDWKEFQEESKRQNKLETKSKESHSVHCPYFPMDKQEYWWLYVADRKNHLLITAPLLVTSLKEKEELEVKFSAPHKPGHYVYVICLKSDSYLDMDLFHQLKFDVKEAKVTGPEPQWDLSDDEDKKRKQGNSDSDVENEDGSSDEYEYDDSDN